MFNVQHFPAMKHCEGKYSTQHHLISNGIFVAWQEGDTEALLYPNEPPAQAVLLHAAAILAASPRRSAAEQDI